MIRDMREHRFAAYLNRPEPEVFGRLSQALKPGTTPLPSADIEAAMSDLAIIQIEAEQEVDAASLTLERVDAFREALNARFCFSSGQR